MPIRVPGIEGVPVGQNPVQPGPPPTPDQSGAVVGGQLQQAGRTVQGEGLRSMRVGQAFIDSANDARSSQQATLHGEELSKLVREYQTSLAADAHDGYEPLNKEIAKLRDRHSKKLTNSQQSLLYGSKVEAQVRQAQGVIDRHYAKQTQAWNLEQIEVGINSQARNYQEAALLGDEHDDERQERMAVARGFMEKEFDKLTKLAGLKGDVAKEQKRKQLAELHAKTFEALVDTNAEQAEDYLEEFGDEMDVNTRTRAQKIAKSAVKQDRMLKRVRGILDGLDDATPNEKFEAVVAMGSEIKDAEELRLFMSYAGAAIADEQRIDTGKKNDLLNSVEQLIYSKGGTSMVYEDLPPSMQQQLAENGMVNEVVNLIGQRDRVSQELVMQSLIRRPEQLRGVEHSTFVRSHQHKLSKPDFKVASDIYYSVNPEVSRPGTAVPAILDHKDSFIRYADQNGYSKEELEEFPERVEELHRLRLEFQKLVEQGRITKEKTHDQNDAEVAELFKQQVEVPGTFAFGFGRDARQAPLLARPEGGVVSVVMPDGSVGDVPIRAIKPGVYAEIQRRLREAARADGQSTFEPSHTEVVQAWVQLESPKNLNAVEAAVEAATEAHHNRVDPFRQLQAAPLNVDDLRKFFGEGKAKQKVKK